MYMLSHQMARRAIAIMPFGSIRQSSIICQHIHLSLFEPLFLSSVSCFNFFLKLSSLRTSLRTYGRRGGKMSTCTYTQHFAHNFERVTDLLGPSGYHAGITDSMLAALILLVSPHWPHNQHLTLQGTVMGTKTVALVHTLLYLQDLRAKLR